MMKKIRILSLLLLFFLFPATLLPAASFDRLEKATGPRDAVLIADPSGNIIFSRNADKPMIPASTLKVLTALVARHYLKPDFRFVTEFYTDDAGNLKIKGYGDPLLISEHMPDIARAVAGKIDQYNDLVIDVSYFGDVVIPGVTASLNPYDAPNSAFAVNFNTVTFKRKNGTYVSAEPQTPLLPFVMDRVRKSGLRKERIVLSAENDESVLYAGHLFRHFLAEAGVRSGDGVRTGTVRSDDQLIHRHVSPYSLDDVIAKLLEYSNNFIANQLFITAGIAAYGAPGTLEKGIRAATAYLEKKLKGTTIRLAEGSGISRENRVTAKAMLKVLEKFAPHYRLMRREGREYFKTGSLSGIKTRMGYIKSGNSGFYRFVVLVNTPGKSTNRIMSEIHRVLE